MINLRQTVFAVTPLVAFLLAAPLLQAEEELFTAITPLEREGQFEASIKTAWEDTCKENLDRWNKELTGNQNHEKLRHRQIWLGQEWLKSGGKPEEVAACYDFIAWNCRDIGMNREAMVYWKKMSEEFPGQTEIAARALDNILRTVNLDNMTAYFQGREWCRYAARRMLALNRAGLVGSAEDRVLQARRAWFKVLLADGNGSGAMALAKQLLEDYPNDIWIRRACVQGCLETGRADLALEELDRLLSDDNRWHDEVLRIQSLPDRFPCKLSLESRWTMLRNLPAESVPAVAQKLLDELDGGNGLSKAQDETYASIWALLDREMRAADKETQEALRALQDKSARGAFNRSGESLHEAMRACRRYPWASCTAAALTQLGGEYLRKGKDNLAAGFFRDAWRHAAEPAQRDAALGGLLLALAQQPGSTETMNKLAQDTGATEYAWFGKKLPAAEFRAALAAAQAAAEAEHAAPNGVNPRQVRLERMETPALPDTLWNDFPPEIVAHISALPTLVPAGDGALAASALGLAYYNRDGRKLWEAHAVVTGGDHPDLQELIVPGPVTPCVSGATIYTRWGVDATAGSLHTVAAFSLTDGSLQWAADLEDAGELLPAGDPVESDGLVYILAYSGELQSRSLIFHLVCLDAVTGALQWKNTLCDISGTTPLHFITKDNRWMNCDLSLFGSPLTVYGGSVYLTTGSGTVAKCDARDGTTEWLRAYPRLYLRGTGSAALGKTGGAPLVYDNLAIIHARDQAGILALNCDTGATVWERPFQTFSETIRQHAGLLVLRDPAALEAIELATGKTVWRRSFSDGFLNYAACAQEGIFASVNGKTLLVGYSDGMILQEHGGNSDGAKLLTANTLFTYQQTQHNGGNPATLPELALPVREIWSRSLPDAKIILPPPEAETGDDILVGSGPRLERLRPGNPPTVLWSCDLACDDANFGWGKDRLYAAVGNSVCCLNLDDGTLLWQTSCDDYAIGNWSSHIFLLPLKDDTLRVLYTEGGQWLNELCLTAAEGKLVRVGQIFGPGKFKGYWLLGAYRDRVYLGSGGRNLEISSFDFGQPEKLDKLPYIFKATDWGERTRRLAFLGGDTACLFARADGVDPLRPAQIWQFNLSGKGEAYYTQEPMRIELTRNTLQEYLPYQCEIRLRGLEDGKEERYRLRPLSSSGSTIPLAACARGGRFFALSDSCLRGVYGLQPRLDELDRRSGKIVRSQTLPGGPNLNAVFCGNALLMSDHAGLRAYAAAPNAPAPETPDAVLQAFHVDNYISVDGDCTDWRETETRRWRDESGREVTVATAENGNRFCLLVKHRVGALSQHACPEPHGGGTFLELGLFSSSRSQHYSLGLGADGKAARRVLPPEKGASAAIVSAARYDAQSGEIVYELALPICELGNKDYNRNEKFGLALRLWNITGEGRRSRPVFSLGSGMTETDCGYVSSAAVALRGCSPAAERETLEFLSTHGDLPFGWRTLEAGWSARLSGDGQEALEFCAAFVKSCPKSRLAGMALVLMDLALRDQTVGSPTTQVQDFARQAGVAPEALDWYAKQSAVKLKQWVYLEKGVTELILRVDDYRALWGFNPSQRQFSNGLEDVYAGPLPPEGKWVELELPLLRHGLYGKGIEWYEGIVLNGQAHFDRLTLEAAGKQETLFDDGEPDVELRNTIVWDGNVKQSGKRSLRVVSDNNRYTGCSLHFEKRRRDLQIIPYPGGADFSKEPESGAAVTKWLVLGPFAAGNFRDVYSDLPPDTDGLKPGKEYTGAGGAKISWKLADAPDGDLRLSNLSDTDAVYAACTVNLDRDTVAALALNYYIAAKITVNGKLIFSADKPEPNCRRLGNLKLVKLHKGVNVILMRDVSPNRSWWMNLEIWDAQTMQPLPTEAKLE